MILDTVTEKLCVNKQIVTKKEMVVVEGEMIVPDSKPDVLNTICTTGVVCLYKKDISEGKIAIGGAINSYITYMSQDDKDKVRGLNTSLEFSEVINMLEAKEGMNAKVKINIKSIESRVINERKIAVKVNLEIIVKIYSKEEIEMISELQNMNDIQILKDNLSVNSLKGKGNTKIYSKDTITIDNIDNLVEILKVDTEIKNKDIKISYNKVLTKADLEIKMMYLTEDMRVNKVIGTIPLVGFIDIVDIAENNICDTNYELKNIIIKPNQVQEHSIYVEVEVDIELDAYEEKNISMIKDLYSLAENIEIENININTMQEKKINKELKQVREKINVDINMNQKIVDVDVIPCIINETTTNNKIVYECELELKFILVNDNSQIEYKTIKLGFDYNFEIDTKNKNTNNELQIEVSNKDFMIQDGGIVNTNIDLMMCVNTEKMVNTNLINKLESRGNRVEEDYSVIIYIVKKDDTLWKIAKEFGSTVEIIKRVNGIEDEKNLKIAEKLFIPKYSKSRLTSKESNIISYV